MKVDYSKYSAESLLTVRANIDPGSENFEPLLQEMERRSDEILAYQQAIQDEKFSLLEKRVKFIGYAQLAAAVGMSLLVIYALLSGRTSFTSVIFTAIFVSLNTAAGVTAIKERFEFYWLTIVNQSLQIPAVAIGSVKLNYSGLGGIYFSVTDNLSMGFTATLSPGFSFEAYRETLPTQYFAIDILAIIFLVAVITVKNKKQADAKTPEPE